MTMNKLERVKAALERYANPEIQNQHNYKATMDVDDTVTAKAALAELKEVMGRLESEELVEEIALIHGGGFFGEAAKSWEKDHALDMQKKYRAQASTTSATATATATCF